MVYQISLVLKYWCLRFIITGNSEQVFLCFLCHKVRHKPSKHGECMDEIHKLLTQKFPGQSGSLLSLFQLDFHFKCQSVTFLMLFMCVSPMLFVLQ